jgi:hypothetical protein
VSYTFFPFRFSSSGTLHNFNKYSGRHTVTRKNNEKARSALLPREVVVTEFPTYLIVALYFRKRGKHS